MKELPEEIVEYIISFACDRRGYNVIEYEKRKTLDLPRMKRIINELLFWRKMGTSVSWLSACRSQRSRNDLFLKSLKEGNPKIVYNTGAYLWPTEESHWTAIQFLKTCKI